MQSIRVISIRFALLTTICVVSILSFTSQSFAVNPFEPSRPTDDQILRAEKIVSIFENDTPEIQYGYAEKLKDWKIRGITFGRSGFTTCQDGIDVFRSLERLSPRNPLLNYKKLIEASTQGHSACVKNTQTLAKTKFIKAVESAVGDRDFRNAQDEVYAENYMNPALKAFESAHLQLGWSFLVFLDTLIQHGEGDADGFDAILAKTQKITGCSGQCEGYSEAAWIGVFLQERRKVLLAGDAEWKASVARVDDLALIANRDKNLELNAFHFRSKVYGEFDL